MKIMLNPALLFAIIWSITLLLYSSHLSYIIEPIKNETVIMICLSLVAFVLPFLLYTIVAKKPYLYPNFSIEKYKLQITSKRISNKVKRLAWFWLLMSTLELFQAKNFPLLSLFGVGPYVNYVEFGISGLHGLLNAIFLFLSCFYFVKYKAEGKNKYLFILMLLFVWPVLLTTRQLMLSYCIQLFFIHLLTTKINLKKIFKIAVFVLAIFSIFGYLGDVRSGREHMISLSRPTFDYPEYLPSFFIWIYIYIVSPLNNINHNITEITPLYFPFNTIISLFPSVVRELLVSFFQVDNYNIKLVTEAFNVSSFYEPFLLDFGYILQAPALLVISSISILAMHRANNKIMYVFILSIILHGITLSVFTNFLTHIVFVFQMMLSFFIFKVRFK
ncbi:O-antigen polymerase [Vibrio aestuarianus]|uniref:O-antigen ligase n=1 Tax=Vibrio aestuarianus TaxID=28171 RepID=A0ABD7YKV9_9VIBR|nr:O-antigen polymerase [Vibrio aestuarianus]WGK85207.1 O-antigen ligase [Vibrio aestuarianus]CAH8222936.1 putative transmembrane protein [Vibrio aestuarianus]